MKGDISSWLSLLRRRLASLNDTAALDAQVLLAHIVGKPRAWILAHPEAKLTPNQATVLETALSELESGQPLPYVLGHWEFYGLDFWVTPATLVPRPETELLVEQALSWLRVHPNRHWALDVGTGSGCIAVSLAVHTPDLKVVASDISLPALEIARRNAQRHNVKERVYFVQSDLLPATSNPFDLICANLPYIPTQTAKMLPVAQREPWLALDGGTDGLELIGRLLQTAPCSFTMGGLLLLEIEAGQRAAAYSLAQAAFPQAKVQVLPDLAGNDRLLVLQE